MRSAGVRPTPLKNLPQADLDKPPTRVNKAGEEAEWHHAVSITYITDGVGQIVDAKRDACTFKRWNLFNKRFAAIKVDEEARVEGQQVGETQIARCVAGDQAAFDGAAADIIANQAHPQPVFEDPTLKFKGVAR